MNGPGSTLSDEARRQALSALMDGDADEAATERACAVWRAHPDARADWHVYHVIADALRTPDLSPSATGDAAFLEAFRERLKSEPVVVAPVVPVVAVKTAAAGAAAMGAEASAQAVSQAGSGPNHGINRGANRGAWRAPFAAVAGVAAVAGIVYMTRLGLPDADGAGPVLAAAAQPQLASAEAGASGVSRAQTALVAVPPEAAAASIVIVRDQRMLRDERLDRYLEAHRQFGHDSLGIVPASTSRGVSTLAPER